MPTIKKAGSTKRLRRNTSGERITVDPGIGGSGIAVWAESTWAELVYPTEVFNIYGESGFEGANTQGDKFREFLKGRSVVKVYIEWPEYMPGSLKGNAAAVKGDLLKLTYMASVFGRICYELGIPFEFVKVSLWKGQLPKRVVEARLLRLLPNLEVKSHSWDAVGIGIKAKGISF